MFDLLCAECFDSNKHRPGRAFVLPLTTSLCVHAQDPRVLNSTGYFEIIYQCPRGCA